MKNLTTRVMIMKNETGLHIVPVQQTTKVKRTIAERKEKVIELSLILISLGLITLMYNLFANF